MEPLLTITDPSVGTESDPSRAYFNYLPLDAPEVLAKDSMMRTPCRPAPVLGRAIGVPHLWVKDESKHPTGTTKDRMAAMVLAAFRQFGIDTFVASSTGNSSTALARAVQQDGSMRAHFFCGRDFVGYHNFDVDDRVSLTVVEGNYAAASKAAQEFAREYGLCWEGGYFNWARREGLKIAYLEALDDMGRTPDVIVQAISSGMGMAAAYKGLNEYLRAGRASKMPRMLMAQQDTCSPMADAWREGRTQLTAEDVIDRPQGLAVAILLGDGSATYPYMSRIAAETGGEIVAVSQAALVEKRAMVGELEGIDVCYSAAAAVAAVSLEAERGRISEDEVVLVNLTGRHR